MKKYKNMRAKLRLLKPSPYTIQKDLKYYILIIQANKLHLNLMIFNSYLHKKIGL